MRFLMSLTPLTCMLLAGCASAFDVYHVPPKCPGEGCTKFGDHVLFYALPETVLTVDALVEKKVVEDGPCKAFVNKDFLRAEPKDFFGSLPAEPRTKVTSVALGARTETDPDQVYAIKLSRHWYQKLTSSFSLSESGILTTAEMAAENQAIDFAVTTLKTVAGLAVKLGIGTGGVDSTKPTAECEKIRDEISRLQEMRRDIILRGSFDGRLLDGETITVMLDKSAQREAELATKFLGTATITTATVHCEVTPEDGDRNIKKDLFTIAVDGIDRIGSLCQIPAALIPTQNGTTKVELELATDDKGQLAGVASLVDPERSDPSGLVYRIPATSAVRVLVGNEPKAGDLRSIAQFGLITALPRSADVATYQSTVKATLYPATGALQKLDFAGTPQGTGAITGISEAAGTILDARAAKQKEEEAAKDELAQLERQRKILEERKKIIDLGGNPDVP